MGKEADQGRRRSITPESRNKGNHLNDQKAGVMQAGSWTDFREGGVQYAQHRKKEQAETRGIDGPVEKIFRKMVVGPGDDRGDPYLHILFGGRRVCKGNGFLGKGKNQSQPGDPGMGIPGQRIHVPASLKLYGTWMN